MNKWLILQKDNSLLGLLYLLNKQGLRSGRPQSWRQRKRSREHKIHFVLRGRWPEHTTFGSTRQRFSRYKKHAITSLAKNSVECGGARVIRETRGGGVKLAWIERKKRQPR